VVKRKTPRDFLSLISFQSQVTMR